MATTLQENMKCSGFLVFDVETNGFKPDTIWVIVIYDLVNKTRQSYVGLDQIAEAIERITQAKMVAGHFIAGFDLPVIKRLSGGEVLKESVLDTVPLSKKLCDLPNHKLETWGDLLGLPKLPKPDFDVFSPQMVTYCERDVDLNVLMFEVLLDMLIERNEVHEYPVLLEYLEALAALDKQ